MRARLGFATALLNNASMLLIAEVLSVGDSVFRAQAQSALEDQLSKTQAVVTIRRNDPHIDNICKAASWLDGGSLLARK